MDDRKKTVRDLEGKRREDLFALNGMLENLGAALLSRMEGGDEAGSEEAAMPFLEDRAEYRRLIKEIEDSAEHIRGIEGDIARLKQMEESIQRKEREHSERNGELAERYIRLGERILESDRYPEVTGMYRQQLDALLPKIKSLEDRLDALEEKGDANVFAWIGKSAQAVVLRSFLGKSQGNLRRIYQAAGEQCVSSALEEPVHDAGLLRIQEEIETRRKAQAELAGELAQLREERRGIGDSFGGDGGPSKKIQSLERHILRSREGLRELYLRFGGRLEEAAAAQDGGGLLTREDAPRLEKIRAMRETIGECDRRIETLKASLAIDEALGEITKLQRAITEQRARIAASEAAIDLYSQRIAEVNERVEVLSKLIEPPRSSI